MRGCSNSYAANDINYADGYWTRDMVINTSTNAWSVGSDGDLGRYTEFNSTSKGVRPVIKVAKSNLSD